MTLKVAQHRSRERDSNSSCSKKSRLLGCFFSFFPNRAWLHHHVRLPGPTNGCAYYVEGGLCIKKLFTCSDLEVLWIRRGGKKGNICIGHVQKGELQFIFQEVGLLTFPLSNGPSLVMCTLHPLTSSCACQIDPDNFCLRSSIEVHPVVGMDRSFFWFLNECVMSWLFMTSGFLAWWLN